MNFNLYNRYIKIKNKSGFDELDKLNRQQYFAHSQLLEIQKNKFVQILKSAHNTEFYKKNYNKGLFQIDDDVLLHLHKFPILTKSDIQNNYSKMINTKYNGLSYNNQSGGSTGQPVRLKQSSEQRQYNFAATLRSNSWANSDLGNSCFKFWGAPRDINNSILGRIKKIIKSKISNIYLMDTFNWNEENIVETYRLMERKKPNSIISYASALYSYVDTLEKLGLRSNHTPSGIITSADMLYEYQREKIENYFNTKIFNRYGCREVGLIASECSAHNGMHISMDRLIVEIVDENNMPVPRGTIGRILITDLTNHAMPIIRYEIGDKGCLSTETVCSCGRSFDKIEKIEGRNTDYIKTPSNKFINGAALTTVITKVPNIQQIQLIQNNIDFIEIRIKKGLNYNNEDENKIISLLNEITFNEIKYSIVYTDRILNNISGKFRFIINNL